MGDEEGRRGGGEGEGRQRRRWREEERETGVVSPNYSKLGLGEERKKPGRKTKRECTVLTFFSCMLVSGEHGPILSKQSEVFLWQNEL